MYSAKIILDSINTSDNRLTTFELTYPRIVHSEFMTHRIFSRNAASSRAIPIEKMIAVVEQDPFIPVYWGANQKGMQAVQELPADDAFYAGLEWLKARDQAVASVRQLQRIGDTGVHKQIANRLLEPFGWITVIVTSTEYGNFFAQRCHPDAQPEIQRVAEMACDLYHNSTPVLKYTGEKHLPFVDGYDFDKLVEVYSLGQIVKISIARCGRVSYLTHDGVRAPHKDIEMFDDKLKPSGHWSPFEHVGTSAPGIQSGNFTGWSQERKEYPNEFRSWPV